MECFLARPVIKDNYSFWGAHKPYWGGPRGQKREWVRLLLRNIIINTIVIIVFNIIINTIVDIVFNTNTISTHRRLRCLFVALTFCLYPCVLVLEYDEYFKHSLISDNCDSW